MFSAKEPVAYFFFNRPDILRRSFTAIQDYQPTKLFLVSDGPRVGHPTDSENCNSCRRLVDEMITWKCEVYRNYSVENLGCKQRVSTGIDWFFQHVEEGIIIEDDCIPSSSFFRFCEELLTRYRDDSSVMMISGFNSLQRPQNRYSFYTAQTGMIWGWATWRSAWRLYDVTMKDWPSDKKKGLLRQKIANSEVAAYWTERFDRAYHGLIDTWDYQWIYTMFKHGGVSCTSNINLVQNSGFGNTATHTSNPNDFFSRFKAADIEGPLHFPPNLEPPKDIEFRILRSFFRPSLPTRLYRKLMRPLWSLRA